MAQDDSTNPAAHEHAIADPTASRPITEAEPVATTAAAPLAASSIGVEAAMAATLQEAENEATTPGSRADAYSATPESLPIPNLSGSSGGAPFASIEFLDDVELDVKIELGRTEMYIEDVLRLGVGSVVELDRLAGDPVDIYVNERLVARGEVLVLNDNFCVRVNDIINPLPEVEPHR